MILVGHSLGGILAAEVVLLPPYSPHTPDIFRHRILGLVAFDTPFLGMHPGVIGTGIASLFRTDSTPSEKTANRNLSPGSPSSFDFSGPFADDLSRLPSEDPNFNPAFANDIHIPQRTPIQKAIRFVNKHSDGLTSATKQYALSHLEFGGCMADYPGLKRRYESIRSLEDVDELGQQRDQFGRFSHRVRFVNYYSASTGRHKHPQEKDREAAPPELEMKDLGLQPRPSSEHSR